MVEIASRMKDQALTVTSLAKKSGLSEERVAALLLGEDFSLEELRAIAKALGMSTLELLNKPEQQQKTEVLFRRTLGKKKAQLSEPIQKFSAQIANSFSLTTSLLGNIGWLQSFPQPELTYESAIRAATLFRNRYYDNDQVSPIQTLPDILSRTIGIFVFVQRAQGAEGASALVGGQAFIFLAARTFKPRMLFTLAHELGHLIGRHHPEEEFAFVDPDTDDTTASLPSNKHEAFADAFAGELLLPAAGVGVALKKAREHFGIKEDAVGDIEVNFVARVFGVSFEAAARRFEILKLLPRGGARSLLEHLQKQHGGPEKRADGVGLPPRGDIEFPTVPPQLLDAAIERIRNGQMSVGRASALLRVSISDVLAAHAQYAS
jgi:Zn-dependent peptidase ImmA (M78 family)